MPPNIQLQSAGELIRRKVTVWYTAFNEKGGKRFLRPIVVAGFLVLGAYEGVYLPPQKKSARLQAEIDNAKMMASYSAKYKDLRDQLNVAYARLPGFSDREQWLANSVRESLNVANLLADEFKPVRETEQNGLVFQAASVSLTVRFSEVYDWILRLESAQPLMHLQSIDLKKKTDSIGFNVVTFDVATVIPKKRYQ